MQNNIQQQFKTWLNTSSVWPKTAASVDPAASFQQFQSSVAESRDPECDLPHPTLRTRTHMHNCCMYFQNFPGQTCVSLTRNSTRVTHYRRKVTGTSTQGE